MKSPQPPGLSPDGLAVRGILGVLQLITTPDSPELYEKGCVSHEVVTGSKALSRKLVHQGLDSRHWGLKLMH